MQKAFKVLFVLFSLLSFHFSAAAYALQFADASKTVRLHWKKGKIPIAFSTSLKLPNPSILPQSDVEGALRRSLETWEQVTDIKFETIWADKQTVSPSGISGDGVSLITIAQTPENLLLFGNENEETSAQTRTFYNRQGFISEADVVLNPYQQFSTDGTPGTYDLEATLTHEIGHLLGLEHSLVKGATMQARQGKNGVFNLPAFASRTLAEDDVAGVRAIYGANNFEDECCGTVVGKIVQNKGKSIKKFQVWAEEADSGRVVGEVSTTADGSFRFEGFRAGSYRFYTQDEGQAINAGAEELGSYDVVKDKTINITKKLRSTERNFSIQYAGFNGQLSDLAVPLNNGKSYLIYIGGKNLVVEDLEIGFNAPYFSVVLGSIKTQDYGSDVSVVSFEIQITADAPLGEYSLFVKSPNGTRHFLVGGLTIEKFVNPLNTYVLSPNNNERKY